MSLSYRPKNPEDLSAENPDGHLQTQPKQNPRCYCLRQRNSQPSLNGENKRHSTKQRSRSHQTQRQTQGHREQALKSLQFTAMIQTAKLVARIGLKSEVQHG